MKIKDFNIEEVSAANTDKITSTYMLVTRVMDVVLYNSNKEGGDAVLPLLKSGDDEGSFSNSELIQEATRGIIMALFRDKYGV